MRDEAAGLARRIESESGWHTEMHQDYFSGDWSVYAWQGDNQEDGYTIRFPVQWRRIQLSLAEEVAASAAESDDDSGLVDWGPLEAQPR